ncbi:hypothetical protein SBBP2_1390014 [Burkholderiales bacterium]|nr:hypothetical protein SBBP2_1390014 [Burkholderiales bacterium]
MIRCYAWRVVSVGADKRAAVILNLHSLMTVRGAMSMQCSNLQMVPRAGLEPARPLSG